jgi:hypothetical protein
MIKIQIYIANFNLGEEKYRVDIPGYFERTDSAIIHRRRWAPLSDLATSSEMSAPMVVGFVIVRSESQGGEHESGFTQHVSSVLGCNGRDAANAAP